MAAMDGAAGVIRSQDDNQGQLEILKKRWFYNIAAKENAIV
jgi:hypothetical protein